MSFILLAMMSVQKKGSNALRQLPPVTQLLRRELSSQEMKAVNALANSSRPQPFSVSVHVAARETRDQANPISEARASVLVGSDPSIVVNFDFFLAYQCAEQNGLSNQAG